MGEDEERRGKRMGGDWEGLPSFSFLEMLPAQALTPHSRSPLPEFPPIPACWAGNGVEEDEWEQEVS